MPFPIFLFLFLICLSTRTSTEKAYYWRDYKANIPSDAVSTGSDSYVGQGYLHEQGVFVVQIFRGTKTVSAAAHGLLGFTAVQKLDRVIKILCSKNQSKLVWVRSNNKDFHVDMTRRYPVVGGFDHADANIGMLHIGRVKKKDGVRIGSIRGVLEDAKMTYVEDNRVVTADEYEVLVYSSEA